MGAPEYHDGTFGPIKPIEESLQDLVGNPGEQERTRVLHIGKLKDLVQRADRLNAGEETEPLAKILQMEMSQLRMDVNKILIHLGIDDKSAVLPVKDIPSI